jgi:hypothetical protein
LHNPESELFSSSENKKYASLQEDLKMKSLYCDVSNGGYFHKPNDVITESICEQSMKFFEKRLAIVTSFENDAASKFPIQDMDSQQVEKYFKKIGLSNLLKGESNKP